MPASLCGERQTSGRKHGIKLGWCCEVTVPYRAGGSSSCHRNSWRYLNALKQTCSTVLSPYSGGSGRFRRATPHSPFVKYFRHCCTDQTAFPWQLAAARAQLHQHKNKQSNSQPSWDKDAEQASPIVLCLIKLSVNDYVLGYCGRSGTFAPMPCSSAALTTRMRNLETTTTEPADLNSKRLLVCCGMCLPRPRHMPCGADSTS